MAEWELLANLVRNSESAALEVEPDTLLLNRLALEALVQQRSGSPGVTVLTSLTELHRRLIRLSEQLTRRELVEACMPVRRPAGRCWRVHSGRIGR